MDPNTGPRGIAKQQYATVRRSLIDMEERVAGQDARVRAGFERFLGSLDRIAGWLLDDDELSRRGQALMRGIEYPAITGKVETPDAIPEASVPDETPELDEAVVPDEAHVADEASEVSVSSEIPAAPEVTTSEPAVPDEPFATGDASVLDELVALDEVAAPDETSVPDKTSALDETPVVDETRVPDEAPVVDETHVADESDDLVGTVDVTFTLPAEVQADSVALAGEFNQWSVQDIQMERGSDATWRATVALQPGRSYRYRYLIDGERWENAWHADRYVPNPFGSVDSVIIVGPPSEN